MSSHEVHVKFPGKIVLVGFGSIGQGVLPLILRHIGTSADRITIVTAEDAGRAEAESFRRQVRQDRADPRELPAYARAAARPRRFPAQSLGRRLEHRAHRAWRANAARCISTPASSPGPGGYTDPKLSRRRAHATTPCARRRSRCATAVEGRADRRAHARRESRPGVASGQAGAAQHRQGRWVWRPRSPTSREQWAKLAQTAGHQGHSHRRARHPGQQRYRSSSNEFVNTWSVDGFVSEGAQPAELGWGTHEKHFPADGRPPRVRLRLRDLPEPPGRQHPRAHLDAEGGAISTAF